MNADRLLALYDRIAEADDAIPRLRRFVLDLAVRGKLVAQDPDDEPAAELLERVTAEKTRLVKTRAIRKPKAVSPLEPDDLPFPLPRGWTWTQIAEIGIISPRNEADDDLEASFVPMPMIAAEYGLANGHEPRPWGEIKKGYTHFAEGDVGLAKITPCFENGKSTVFRNLTGGIGAGTTELHVVRPLLVNSDYIVLFLKSPQFIETGIPRMTGTAGQKRVPTEFFTGAPFPLPPLAEQHRIVAKVDELMALLDRLEVARSEREAIRDRLSTAGLARLTAPDATAAEWSDHARFALDALPALSTRPDQIKALRQTILNLAVRGKLVERMEADGAASSLIEAIRAEGGRGKRQVADPNMTLVNFSIPSHWAWQSLDSVLTYGPQNGLSPKKSERNDAPKAIILTATTSGAFDAQHFKRVDVRPSDAAGYWLEPGDILFQRGNTRDYVGMAAIYDGPSKEFLFPDLIMRVKVSPRMSARFVHLWCIAPFARHYLSSNATGAQQTMPKINQGILRSLPVAVPPLAEQHRIVAKVDALMTLCDRLETALTNASTTRAHLLEAVLHEALTDTNTRERATVPA